MIAKELGLTVKGRASNEAPNGKFSKGCNKIDLSTLNLKQISAKDLLETLDEVDRKGRPELLHSSSSSTLGSKGSKGGKSSSSSRKKRSQLMGQKSLSTRSKMTVDKEDRKKVIDRRAQLYKSQSTAQNLNGSCKLNDLLGNYEDIVLEGNDCVAP